MKIKIKSTVRPCLVTTPKRTKTLIVGGTITEVNGEEWNHAYVAIMPGNRITLEDIEWECAGDAASEEEEVTCETYAVRGSGGNVYTVYGYSDGSWECTCPSFKFRNHGKQYCKHIEEVR